MVDTDGIECHLASRQHLRYSKEDAAIQNLPGVYTVADDILVTGKEATQQAARNDYDSKITQLLNRCREKGLKLNQEKCKIAMLQVACMGHYTDRQLT